MNRELWRRSLMQVGVALQDPEGFAAAWQMGQARYALATWVALGATAVAGTVGFGMTIGMGHGLAAVVAKAFWLTAAAGAAWAIPLPALYIFNSPGGSGPSWRRSTRPNTSDIDTPTPSRPPRSANAHARRGKTTCSASSSFANKLAASSWPRWLGSASWSR